MGPDAFDEVARLETEADGCPDCTTRERRDLQGRVVGAIRVACAHHRAALSAAYHALETTP